MMPESVTESVIGHFFQRKNVFITGGTGFVGKVLVEKLLRSCPGIGRIYLLIRPKKGQTSDQRLQSLLDCPLFKLALNPTQIRDKLVAIDGDLTQSRMGVTDVDYELLRHNISVVLHVAGDVKFDESAREAITHNLIGTKNIIDLCNDCQRLETLVHVSTAYAFCNKLEVKEVLYDMKVRPEDLIEAVKTMDDQQLERYVEPFLEGRPNYYTFTKALAEHLVTSGRPAGLPLSIVRPSIVLSAYSEPIKGWIDNFNGPTGIAVLGALGICRNCDCDTSKRLSFIPVDMTANAIIASAWHSATFRPSEPQIYNLASELEVTPPMAKLVEHFLEAARETPTIKAIRPVPGVEQTRPTRIRLWLTLAISHILFAHFVDTIIKLLGHKPIMVMITARMHNGFKMLKYFMIKEWKFHTKNTKRLIDIVNQNDFDSNEFKFDISSVNWTEIPKDLWIGGRKYLLKEPDDNIKMARQRYIKVTYGYRIFLLVWYSLVLFICYFTTTKLTRIFY